MKLVFATHNPHKVKEIKPLLPNSIELLSLEDINCNEDIKETANTIAGNALLKVQYVKENYGYNCFADDTGLEVEALDNAPGVFSARYAGPEKDDSANIDKLLKNLETAQNRNAKFKTVIAIIINDKEMMFTGICKGEILEERKGESGFGYDPIFQPQGYDESFAEMNQGQKSKISHRGKALAKLVHYLHSNYHI